MLPGPLGGCPLLDTEALSRCEAVILIAVMSSTPRGRVELLAHMSTIKPLNLIPLTPLKVCEGAGRGSEEGIGHISAIGPSGGGIAPVSPEVYITRQAGVWEHYDVI